MSIVRTKIIVNDISCCIISVNKNHSDENFTVPDVVFNIDVFDNDRIGTEYTKEFLNYLKKLIENHIEKYYLTYPGADKDYVKIKSFGKIESIALEFSCNKNELNSTNQKKLVFSSGGLKKDRNYYRE